MLTANRVIWRLADRGPSTDVPAGNDAKKIEDGGGGGGGGDDGNGNGDGGWDRRLGLKKGSIFARLRERSARQRDAEDDSNSGRIVHSHVCIYCLFFFYDNSLD